MQAWEYLNLRCKDEMTKLCKRFAVERKEEPCLVAKACEVDNERVTEVLVVQWRHILPSMLVQPKFSPMVIAPLLN